ncbi:hypothetical protein PRIEUP_LOCUS1035 [Pristimantis euphronides]
MLSIKSRSHTSVRTIHGGEKRQGQKCERVRSLTSKMWKLSAILLISAAVLYMIDADPGASLIPFCVHSYCAELCVLFWLYVLFHLTLPPHLLLHDLQTGVKDVHKCPKNKIWNDCGTICTPNCATVKGWACPFICRLGAGTCTCRSPYVFLSGKSGPCVLPKDCPKK